MSETQQLPAYPQAQYAEPIGPELPEAPVGRRTGWRERLLGLRAVIAVALAGVVLGGAGGYVAHAVSDGSGQTGFGPGQGGRFGGQPGGQFGGQFGGQLPGGGQPGGGQGFGQPGGAPGTGSGTSPQQPGTPS